jgi:hypothetical protein
MRKNVFAPDEKRTGRCETYIENYRHTYYVNEKSTLEPAMVVPPAIPDFYFYPRLTSNLQRTYTLFATISVQLRLNIPYVLPLGFAEHRVAERAQV